jgi:glycosyltransferase involved in cell wall biosynthesis
VAPPYGWRREVQFSVAARLCRAVVAVCDQAAVNLKGAPLAARRKIVRIYNGTEPAPNPIEAREIPPKMGLTAITVGRLTEAKDQATLLRAVALVKPRIPDFNLWVVGGGALAESLHLLREKLGLGNTVRFLGEQKAVGGFLRQADLFVLSSISEGLPVSLLEAMAVGLPVVTTSVGGMPEVVAPSGCGLVVPSQDPAALAEAICKLAVDQGSRELMGRAGRKFFLDNFTGERMDAEYLKLY